MPLARGDTALKLAIMRHRDDVAQYLIARAANPCAPDIRGDTPLHEALRNDDARMVRALLVGGARIITNRYGLTAADEAKAWAADLLPVFDGRSQ
jgi:ankyrin repeat protein